MKLTGEKLNIHNKYQIIEKIGKGKFGDVYKGINQTTSEYVAVKLENNRQHIQPLSRDNISISVLKHETRIINFLHNKRCNGIPYIYWYGTHCNIPSLIMPYYKYSIYDLFTLNNKRQTIPPNISSLCYDGTQSADNTPTPRSFELPHTIVSPTISNGVLTNLTPSKIMIKIINNLRKI
jgi:serine/threonine protein kinase